MSETMTKPQLPNPGDGFWWELEYDSGYFNLYLRKQTSDYGYRTVWQGYQDEKTATAEALEKQAVEALKTVNKMNKWVGIYNKDEENN